MQKTGIIIPCYNESKRLNVYDFDLFLNQNQTVFLLFVNDGSKDNTLDILQKLVNENQNAKLLNLKENQGKAEAVRQGLLFAFEHFDWDNFGYFDADLATPLNEINNFKNKLENGDYKMIIGSRTRRLGSHIERTQRRHFLGRIFATAASITLALPVYDTQCGAKLFKKEIVKPIFFQKFISTWLFDVEILARYILEFGYKSAINQIYEYPLETWKEISESKIKFKDFAKFPIDLWRIYSKYHKSIIKLKKLK